MCLDFKRFGIVINNYVFDYQINQSDTRAYEARLMLFNAMVVQVLLYGMELWAGIISLSAWNEIDKIQKIINWELNPHHPVLSCFRNMRLTHRVAMQRIYK